TLSLAGTPTWTILTPTGTPPPARTAHSAIYDPVRDRMVVFGGGGASSYLDDVWVLSSAGPPAWAALTSTGMAQSGRAYLTAIYDPVHDRMVTLGGVDGSFDYFHDGWSLSLAATPAWTPYAPTDSLPPVRAGHSAIYDPVRDRMVVFGGQHPFGLVNDVWAL